MKILYTAWIACLLFACRGGGMPSDFSLVLEESGGFTGWSTIVSLASDGGVEKRVDRHDGEIEQQELPSLDEPSRRLVWERLEAARWQEKPSSPPGNLNRRIEVMGNGETYVVKWDVGTEGNEDLDTLFTQLRNLLVPSS